MFVKINGVIIDAETVERNEEEGSYYISFYVKGENEKNLYNELLIKDEVELIIEDLGIEFTANRKSSSSSYVDPLDEDTIVKLGVSYEEKVNEEPFDKWSIFDGYTSTSIENWVRTRAISELLIEKGILNDKEYLDKINDVYDRDYDEMKSYLLNGPESSDSEKE